MNKITFKDSIHLLRNKSHVNHPFHKKINDGQVSKTGVQLWVVNKHYYNKILPKVDSAIIMNCDNQIIRKKLVENLIKYNHYDNIQAWKTLANAVGISNETLESEVYVLPSVKFAIDSYLNYCKINNYNDSLTTKITELFTPNTNSLLLENWPVYYKWIDPNGYKYFQNVYDNSHKFPTFIIENILDYYKTEDQQLRALRIIEYKLSIQWAVLDAVEYNHMFYSNTFIDLR